MIHTTYHSVLDKVIDLKEFSLIYNKTFYPVKAGKIEKRINTQSFNLQVTQITGFSNEFTLQLSDSTLLNLNSMSDIKLVSKKDTYTGVITYSDSTGLIKGIIK